MPGRSQKLPQSDEDENDGLFAVSEQKSHFWRFNDRSKFCLLSVCAVLLVVSVVFNVIGLLDSQSYAVSSNNVQRVSQRLNNATIPAWKPLPDPSSLITRLAFGSCSSQEYPQPYWDTVTSFEPDIFLLMGDNVYGDCSDAHCTELRQAYFELASHPSVQGAAPKVSVFATLDDHDYGQQDCHADNPHKEIAVELFADFFDLAPTLLPEKDGVYRSRVWGPPGQRLQVILLDTRYSRSPFQTTGITSAPYEPRTDSNGQMLSELQWQWLEEQLQEPAELRVVVSSVQVLSNVTGFECWRHLPQERDRLFRTLSNHSVVLLSGDRHMGGLFQHDFVEALASSLTHSIPLGTFSDCSTALECDEGDPYRLGDAIRDNHFGFLQVDWEEQSVQISLRRTEQSRFYRVSKTGAAGEILTSKTYSFQDLRSS